MAGEGVELLAGLDRLAVLGFTEVIRHLPDLLALRRTVYSVLEAPGVDLVVPIDYPGFNLPLSGRARRLSIPVLYYIAPQVWAWKQKRARRLAAWADEVCVVLPFERDLLASYGVNVQFVGHPLLDQELPVAQPDSSALGLFPGSRRQEVERMLPVFLAAASQLRDDRPGLRVLVARSDDLPDSVYAGCPDDLLASPDYVVRNSRAAITKSGTITLQLAIAGVPMVVGYRVHPLTYQILRRLVRLDYIALVNLVAERRVVEERIQGAMTAQALAAEATLLLDDTEQREDMCRQLAGVRQQLGRPGAAGRVADRCMALLRARGFSS
jgi:lipid-A-disaccharide synthase